MAIELRKDNNPEAKLSRESYVKLTFGYVFFIGLGETIGVSRER